MAVLLRAINHAISWGVDFVQLREKDLADGELFRLTTHAVRLARGTTCRILVNGRIDVALAAKAHGVHLPSAGLESADARPHLPRGFLVGVSSHSLREARRAAAGGADYILLGPIFRTASKIRYGRPLGLVPLKRVCHAVHVPVFGLGGIQPKNVSSVLSAGACGVAGIGLFQKRLDVCSRDDWADPVPDRRLRARESLGERRS
jgi:thiamine-phosphate pyrophosphorylase